jgi:hypothetical protein
MAMGIIKFIKDFLKKRKQDKIYKKRLEELRKRDPFTYKNH